MHSHLNARLTQKGLQLATSTPISIRYQAGNRTLRRIRASGIALR